ncbi:MAG: hypothetical protein M3Y27_03025 [Acidobacteriota bacterium]|nr:hypothetical protein [Acidobacteriota bacterium]
MRFRPALVAYRGKLYSSKTAGEPIHAGTDIPKRIVILDSELTKQPLELARILIHEVFHFAWVRLGNPLRDSYAELLGDEFRRGARGELGWSAEYRKLDLLRERGRGGGVAAHPRWREYVCESFCDTAAWRYLNVAEHDEFTLRLRNRKRRERWFAERFDDGLIRV